MEGIRIFGASDRKNKHHKGDIMSHMPGWYEKPVMEMRKEAYESEQRLLDQGRIPSDERHTSQARVRKNKDQYEGVMKSMPVLRDGDKDKVAKFSKEIGQQISESMFTDSEMRKGTASAHIEADRMAGPCIKMNPEIAKACNVRVFENGMVSRNGAIKCRQIAQRLLGENTNPEMLRRP